MVDLDDVKKAISAGKPLESVLEKFNWKQFENLISQIFEQNGFVIKNNFRFKTKNRYEIDILAINNRLVLCIDCKEWNQGRHKKTGLKYAAEKQEKRLKELEKFLRKNPIAREMLGIKQKIKFYPMIVTLFEEGLVKENGTIVIPAWKLNGFLLEIDNYLD